MGPAAVEHSPIRLNPRRAIASWRGVLNPVANHEQFLELIFALGGTGFEQSYQRFRDDPDGQRLLRERPDIVAALTDGDRLRALPRGTLGHAYSDFMRRPDRPRPVDRAGPARVAVV